MSINSILATAVSGLNTNQSALRTTAQNVANVNNTAYVRRQVEEESVTIGGNDGGVRVAQIKRIAAEFLTGQILDSRSASGTFDAMSSIESQLQGLFGRPDLSSSMPSLVNTALASPSELTLDPVSAPRRIGYLQDLNSALGSISSLSHQVLGLRANTDTSIAAKVTTANSLIRQIFELNASIKRSQAIGGGEGDPSLIDQRADNIRQLSDIMSIRTNQQSDGSIQVTTDDGFALVTEAPTELTYTAAGTTSAGVIYDPIQAVRINPNNGQPSGPASNFDQHAGQGALRGLLTMRDAELPNLLVQLGELGAGMADQLNAVHNDSVAVPPPQTLSGRQTGVVTGDSLGFTGQTYLAIVDSTGVLVRKVEIDFDAGTTSINEGGGPALGTTVDSAIDAINTALGPDGTATLTNGQLTISASASGNGVGFVQWAPGGSSRGGRSFSQFFGLNDLVTGFRPSFFATGLSASDTANFATGQTMKFNVRGPNGDIAKTLTYTTILGETIGDIVNNLNDPTTGLGTYMGFALDASGKLTATPTGAYQGYQLQIAGDDTDRGGTGVSFSSLFGLGLAPQVEQARGLGVDPAILQDPTKLSLAQLDLPVFASFPGDVVATQGDSRGAQALSDLVGQIVGFNAAGDLNGMASTIGDYAALVVANSSSKAASTDQLATAATAIKNEVETQRSSVEGVNLDEELSNMIIYQQAYNAAARLVSVAQQLYDTLLKM
jgi:flagellar hook-associated protein 1 FlgK